MTEAPTTLQSSSPGNPLRREQRQTVRYALEACVVFSWIDRDGVSRQGRGCTRDISTRGAYILCSGWPPPGASVTLSIYIPLLIEEARVLRIETKGRVLRVEPAGECGGFSLRNDRVTTFTNEKAVR